MAIVTISEAVLQRIPKFKLGVIQYHNIAVSEIGRAHV